MIVTIIKQINGKSTIYKITFSLNLRTTVITIYTCLAGSDGSRQRGNIAFRVCTCYYAKVMVMLNGAAGRPCTASKTIMVG